MKSSQTITLLIGLTCCCVLLVEAAGPSNQQQHHNQSTSVSRLLRPSPQSFATTESSTPTNSTQSPASPVTFKRDEKDLSSAAAEAEEAELDNAELEDGDSDDEEEDDDDGESLEDEHDDDLEEDGTKNNTKIVSDLFGNKLKMEGNRTALIGQSKARDLGLLTLKAILLGPLIGITIKAALIRGLIWAIGAYGLHLFFPAALSTLGLGTGLVGFARQIQPDYLQMLTPHLSSLQNSIPTSFRQMLTQYRQVLQPVVESVRSIPEGQCRYRAVCELAHHSARNARGMATTLQRISATVYLNFGTEYAKAWLDGIVQGDCAAKYLQCPTSPLSMVAARLAETLRNRGAAAASSIPQTLATTMAPTATL